MIIFILASVMVVATMAMMCLNERERPRLHAALYASGMTAALASFIYVMLFWGKS